MHLNTVPACSHDLPGHRRRSRALRRLAFGTEPPTFGVDIAFGSRRYGDPSPGRPCASSRLHLVDCAHETPIRFPVPGRPAGRPVAFRLRPEPDRVDAGQRQHPVRIHLGRHQQRRWPAFLRGAHEPGRPAPGAPGFRRRGQPAGRSPDPERHAGAPALERTARCRTQRRLAAPCRSRLGRGLFQRRQPGRNRHVRRRGGCDLALPLLQHRPVDQSGRRLRRHPQRHHLRRQSGHLYLDLRAHGRRRAGLARTTRRKLRLDPDRRRAQQRLGPALRQPRKHDPPDPDDHLFNGHGEEAETVPADFRLEQNFPNPFHRATTITFALPAGGPVRLRVYDLLGQEIATLVDGFRAAGTHTVDFVADGWPAGLYLYRLEAGGRTRTRTMALLK
ncbi:MAG: hypothetical protein KatS3mg043_1761 [Rhodothermaceae bacterium]|nr:MAG: hypothetical protein KatS3mg043_1761 [Rhodothermaceae bacterium]